MNKKKTAIDWLFEQIAMVSLAQKLNKLGFEITGYYTDIHSNYSNYVIIMTKNKIKITFKVMERFNSFKTGIDLNGFILYEPRYKEATEEEIIKNVEIFAKEEN